MRQLRQPRQAQPPQAQEREPLVVAEGGEGPQQLLVPKRMLQPPPTNLS